MIMHIVLLHWNDYADETAIRKVTDAFDKLPSLIPEIKSCRHGSDAQIFSGNADYVVAMEFANEADLKTYVFHPEHQRLLKEATGPILASYSGAQLATK
jgi:hypothetical protein